MEIGNKIKPDVELIDGSFQPKMAADHQLNLLISNNKFGLSLFNVYQNNFIGFQEYSIGSIEDIDEVLNEEIFQNEFNGVQAMINIQASTLVPTALFDEENKEELNNSLYDLMKELIN